MMDGGHNKDDQFQGSLNAGEENEQNEQNVPENVQGLDLGAILGGLMGGGMGGGQTGGMSDMNSTMAGMGGTPFDGIIGSVAGDLSAKTGLPKEIITMGAMFLISKLMMGGVSGNSQQDDPQAGGLDLGGLLGSILGGAMPSMDQGLPQRGGMDTQADGEVLGKIGKQIDEGLNSPHLTAGGLQQSGLAGEFAEMSGLSEDEAAQSLHQIVGALKQSGLSQ